MTAGLKGAGGVGKGVVVALLGLLCLITLYPFVYILMYSFSSGSAAAARTVTVYPIEPTLDNFRAVFTNPTIMNSFLISVSRTVVGAASHLVVTGLVAYALSKKYLIFRQVFVLIFIVPMYFHGGLLPFYVVILKLNLNNNFLVYILPMIFVPFNMLIMKVFFQQLPEELEESAVIDGANHVTIFVRIVLPSSTPIIATVLLFIGVDQWNAWFDALLFVTKAHLMPLQTLLYRIILEYQANTLEKIMRMMQSDSSVTSEAIKAASLIVVTAPILCSYPFLQRYFVKGLLIGAIKG